MQILRDAGRIRVQRNRARLLTAAGILLLIGVLITSNMVSSLPSEAMFIWILLSYGGLIAGFICFNAGLQGVAKWSRRPRRDEIIDNHLKRLNDRFHIFHYPTLDKRTFDHVVVHSSGVTTLVARDNFGKVTYLKGRWSKGANVAARIFNFAGPPIGNPHSEAATAAQALQERLHAEGITAEVDAVIVFVNPRVELTVDESAIPIRRVEDLAALLREKAADNRLQGGQRLQIIKLLTAGIPTPDEGVAAGKGKGRPRPVIGTRPVGDRAARRTEGGGRRD